LLTGLALVRGEGLPSKAAVEIFTEATALIGLALGNVGIFGIFLIAAVEFTMTIRSRI